MPTLSGKTAIVTGASRGIGHAIARKLAAEGAQVVINYTRSATEAETLATDTGGLAVQADIADPLQVAHLFDTAEAHYGPLDILINNAGVAIFSPIAAMSLEDFDRTFAINTRGAFLCAQQAARRLRDNGRIVAISTGATFTSGPNSGAYCGSKAALEQFTRALAKELGHRGITANTVSPGFTDTDMLHQFPHLVAIAQQMSPLGRMGQPQDVADVVAWLCTEQARWVTGQNLQAGGGVSMA